MLIFVQCNHEWTCTKALAQEEYGKEKLTGFVSYIPSTLLLCVCFLLIEAFPAGGTRRLLRLSEVLNHTAKQATQEYRGDN